MTGERWDVPSPRLAKIAAQTNTPSMRPPCAKCHHRHPRGELCGAAPYKSNGWCDCRIGNEA